MWQMLLKLNPLSKNSIILILLTLNMGFFTYVRISRDSLKKAEAMYDHPATSKSLQTRKEKGSVHIVEHIVEGTAGTRTIDRTITRDPVVTTRISLTSSTPVAPAGASLSSGRYLLGASWRASLADQRNGTVWAGYSFWNRVDVLGGIGIQNQKGQANLMVLTRWGK